MNGKWSFARALTIAFSLLLTLAGIGVADTLTDDFSGASIDGARWHLPPWTEGTGQLTQTGGRLEFTASIELGGANAEGNIQSKAVGAQDANWYVEVSTTLDGPFPGMGSEDVVSPTLGLRPSGPTSQLDGDEQFEISAGYVDLSNFGGSGFGYGLHHGIKTNGTYTSETFLSLGNTGPQSLRFRIEYDAVTKKLKALYDAGSGFMAFGAEADTGTWNMAGEYFEIWLSGYAGNMEGSTPSSAYSVGSGQLYFDDFVASGQGITIVPEPALGAPLALLSLALVRATARRVRAARR